jgi:DNA-binding NarL/FixJ family response regulator
MLESEDSPEEILLQLKELLGFPKHFLEQSKGNLRTLVPLTKREKEVLLLLPRGLTAKAMASELFLTEATIKTHLATIYRKFEVRNRSQAIAIGIENRLLTF